MEWKLITVRISKPLHTALETKALQTNLTLGEYARHQLSETLSNQNQSASNNAVMEKKIDDLKKELATNLDAFAEAVDKKVGSTYDLMVKLNSNFSIINKQITAAMPPKGG
jgi:small-conductance mechanosensitive channel